MEGRRRGELQLLTPGKKTAQRVAFVTVGLTVVLVGVGVLVRATGSGLGCPDWPLCHGGPVPPGQKHALIEFSHRFTAMVVGFMVIAVAVLAWKVYRQSSQTVFAAIAVVPLVGFQGVLGAITVKRELPPEVVATHLITAMAVLSLELFVAISMFLEDPDHRRSSLHILHSGSRRLGLFALGAAFWLVVLMWIGAYMSESGASTACSGWPRCNGGILPGSDNQEVVHMVHRYLAAGFALLVAPCVWAAYQRRREVPLAARLGVAAGGLYVAQVLIGALNVWYTFPDALAVSHTVVASLVWVVLSTTAITSFYRPSVVRSELSGAGAVA
jgi:heme A synthase